MKKIRLLALLMLGFVANVAFAQNIRVSGVVKSAEDGQPLPGVMVLVKGTTNGVGAGADGTYTINNVPSNGTLEFRYLGMQPMQVAVNGRTKIDVTLQPDVLQAEAVTVTALGVKKQDRKLGYAATTVKGDELARTNTINPITALQGKVAGVQINAIGAGGVTNSPMILIRGAKSLDAGRNSPIFVIDGIIMENKTVVGFHSEEGYGTQLKNLNPDEYESITVLKGAAATSLYGSRGANGAIVITSKSGKVRKGVGIEASYTHEFQSTYAAPFELQNEFGVGSPFNGVEGDEIPGANQFANAYSGYSFGEKVDPNRLVKQWYRMPDNNPEPYVDYEDNWKAFFQDGSYDRATIALTGGSDRATYRLSYGYTKMKGAMLNNAFSSHSVNFRTNGRLNDVFSVDMSVIYTNAKAYNNPRQGAWWYGQNYSMLLGYYANRSTDLQWYKDNYVLDPTTWETIPTNGSDQISQWRSRFESANQNNETQDEQTIIAQVGLNAQFNKWLDASVSVSYNNWQRFTETKNYGGERMRAGGKYAIAGGTEGSWRGLAQIHSNNRFVDDNLELDIRLMGEGYGNMRSTNFQKETKDGLITPGLFTFANSKSPITAAEMSWGTGPSTGPRNSMTLGLAAIVNLSWKDQINLEVTARNDWISSLLYPTWIPQGANNYSVFYPSANASWVFSDTFNIDPNIVSFGKLRASIAQVGMGTGTYNTAMGAGGFSLSAKFDPEGKSIYSATPNNTELPNFDLKPEIQQSIEFGADVRFLNNRIGVDVTYYKSNTFNQILNLGTVGESGVARRWFNAGNIQNQGWEIQLDFTPIRTREVRWNINLNWTRNRGKIIELGEDIREYQLSGAIDGSPSVFAFEGGAFGQVVAGGSIGGSVGARAMFNDANNANNPLNGKYAIAMADQGGVPYVGYLTGSDMNSLTDGKYYTEEHPYDVVGNIEPDFMMGVTTSLSYKGFDFFAQIDGRVGGTVVQSARSYSVSRGSGAESLPGRSAEHGGQARRNYKGDIVYNGIIVDGVFGNEKEKITSLRTGEEMNIYGKTMQELVDAGHMQPVLAGAYWFGNYNWGMPADMMCTKGTWFTLREISLAYNFPEKWIKHIGMQSAQLSFAARNICYIYNGLAGGSNPEAITVNSPFQPYDIGGAPFSRSFSLSLNVRF